MNTNQIVGLHLYELSHANPGNPLSRGYGMEFEKFVDEKSIRLPDQLKYKFCGRCGQLEIPGLTCSLRIRYGKGRRGRGARRLEQRCLECGYRTMSEDELMAANRGGGPEMRSVEGNMVEKVSGEGRRPEKQEKTQKDGVKGNDNYKIEKASAGQKSKERQKKRKQSSLSSMLEQKRKQEKNKKTLDLMEFMR